MKRPTEKLQSFAAIIVYSMAEDGPSMGSTPLSSKVPSRNTSSGDLKGLAGEAVEGNAEGLGAGLQQDKKERTYLAGSKALDALAKLIQATESFFHPSNYGAWAPQLVRFSLFASSFRKDIIFLTSICSIFFFFTFKQGRFLQTVTYEFYKRQKEEERPECKTPLEWRLTPKIRREFVLTMRTVALLSMFSRDALTIANSQAAIKTMGFLEPELIFPAVLERAYPALETLLEVSC